MRTRDAGVPEPGLEGKRERQPQIAHCRAHRLQDATGRGDPSARDQALGRGDVEGVCGSRRLQAELGDFPEGTARRNAQVRRAQASRDGRLAVRAPSPLDRALHAVQTCDGVRRTPDHLAVLDDGAPDFDGPAGRGARLCPGNGNNEAPRAVGCRECEARSDQHERVDEERASKQGGPAPSQPDRIGGQQGRPVGEARSARHTNPVDVQASLPQTERDALGTHLAANRQRQPGFRPAEDVSLDDGKVSDQDQRESEGKEQAGGDQEQAAGRGEPPEPPHHRAS